MNTPASPRFQVSIPVDARPRRNQTRTTTSPFGAPAGTADVLPATLRIREDLEHRLLEAFSRAGYERVDVPTWEPFSLFGARYGDRLRERLFTLYSDQEYALRPDFTGSVGRLVAGGAFDGRPLPLRLSYAGQVFRYERLEGDRPREFRQVGVELIGAPGQVADLEVLELAVSALAGLELGQPAMRLSHIGVLGRVVASLVPEPAPRQALEAAILSWLSLPSRSAEADAQEAALVEGWTAVVGEDGIRDLLALTRLEGEAAAVRLAAQRLFPELELVELNYLLEVAETLHEIGGAAVRVAPVAVREVGYYQGVCFALYLEGAERPVATGGRYEPLVLELGGRAHGGIGLAVDLDVLVRRSQAVREPPAVPARGVIVPAPETPIAPVMALARRIRDAGYAAVLELEPVEAAQLVERVRAEGAAWVVKVGTGQIEAASAAEGAPAERLEAPEAVIDWLDRLFGR